MDLNLPSSSSQDILRCKLCDTPVPPLYCQLCDINLCKTCVGEHLLDDTKEHKVVPIKQKWNPTNPMCPKHTTKHCELYCKKCDNPICAQCILSTEHDQHKKIDIFERKLEMLESALNTLNQTVCLKYEMAASDIKIKKCDVKKNSEEIKTTIKEHGQEWHREIDNIIKNFLLKVEENESEQLGILVQNESIINLRINEISQIMLDLQKAVNTKDVHLVSEYINKLPEICQIPRHSCFRLPTAKFIAESIDKTQLFDLFGGLPVFEQNYTCKVNI